MSYKRRNKTQDILSMVMDELDLGIVIVDAAGEILYRNPWAKSALLEITERELVARLPSPWLLSAPSARAIAIPRTRGLNYTARVKPIFGTTPPLRLVTLAGGLLRESDFREFLIREFELQHREIEVILEMRAGFNNAEIADRLGVGVSTVRWYVSRIFQALGIRNRMELVVLLDRAGSGVP